MNIAFLFNSDHPSFDGYYGRPIMDKILGTQELQRTNRHMKVSIGNILTYSTVVESKTPQISSLIKLCHALYRPKNFNHLIHDRIEATHGNATVFCWLFQNMTDSIAKAIHKKLIPDTTYVGAMDVDFSEPLHLNFFRNSLCEVYRLHGKQCSVFYDMGHNEDPDIVVQESFEQFGFNVDYEDIGARRTIFDKYDSLEHFKRVEDFKFVFSGFHGLNADHASDLAICLEELHPKLFDTFASAARTINRAETEEDFAQAALSGRRLLESTANYLFPPQNETWNGRKVGNPEYKNRLWAYIEKTITELGNTDTAILQTLGDEVDRLVKLFNAELHANPTKDKVEAAFSALVIWISKVIELDPAAVRKPYLAYEQELSMFFKDVMHYQT